MIGDFPFSSSSGFGVLQAASFSVADWLSS